MRNDVYNRPQSGYFEARIDRVIQFTIVAKKAQSTLDVKRDTKGWPYS